jgi:hypothetical protein
VAGLPSLCLVSRDRLDLAYEPLRAIRTSIRSSTNPVESQRAFNSHLRLYECQPVVVPLEDRPGAAQEDNSRSEAGCD